MGKIIYIIGAGFSADLGAPLQKDIIKEILDLEPDSLDFVERELFEKCKHKFKTFLQETLYISLDSPNMISLEDIYTPIDRCIIDNMSFRNLEKEALLEFRQAINALIIIMMRQKLKKITDKKYNYAQHFARYLVDIRRKRPKSDPFSILSLNWDIILDDAINNEIIKLEAENGKKGIVDYCCYITPFRKEDNLIPGLLARGRNQYNVKLLKLHGSMNWLQCQRCQRLFIAFGEKIAAEEYLSKPQCRLCEKNFSNNKTHDGGAHLISQLIMPTFLKDFNNVQLKLIWQNACVELSEATKLVFMGYSFPAADFELRQLLARSVRHNAKIEVVLKDAPKSQKEDSPEKRYRTFFGKRNVTPFYGGVEEYIKNHCRLEESTRAH